MAVSLIAPERELCPWAHGLFADYLLVSSLPGYGARLHRPDGKELYLRWARWPHLLPGRGSFSLLATAVLSLGWFLETHPQCLWSQYVDTALKMYFTVFRIRKTVSLEPYIYLFVNM